MKKKVDTTLGRPMRSAPRDGTEVIVFFPLDGIKALAAAPAHFMDGTWWARGCDLPQPAYWLPRSAMPEWPPDPNLPPDSAADPTLLPPGARGLPPSEPADASATPRTPRARPGRR